MTPHPTPQLRPPWRAYACLGLSMGLVGAYVALSKPLVAALPVFVLAWLRFAIGAGAMLHWLHRPTTEPALSMGTRGWLLLQSLLGNVLFSICMLYGVRWTSATAAGMVMSALPAVVAMLSWACLRERLSAHVLWAVALAVSGMGLFSWAAPSNTTTAQTVTLWGWPVTLWGNLLILGAVLCEAAYVVIGKRLSAHIGPKRLAALINLNGLLLITPLGAWALWHDGWPGLSPSLWLLLLFYALAASVWSVWLWMTGLRHVEASQAGIFTVMLPVSAATVGVVFLGEQISPLQWTAFGLALTGVLLATLPQHPAHTADH